MIPVNNLRLMEKRECRTKLYKLFMELDAKLFLDITNFNYSTYLVEPCIEPWGLILKTG